MPRFPALILILTACLGLSACASTGSVRDLADRVALLELELGLAQSGMDMTREDGRDLDARLTYLENEAASRGVTIPPRRTPSYVSHVGAEPEIQPEAVYTPPAPQPSTPRPSSAPAGSSQGGSLPSSPVSTASPQTQPETQPETAEPGSLPSPLYEPAGLDGPTEVYEPAPVQQPVQVATAPSGNGSASQRAYDAALQMYRTGRFAEAEAAFNAFLETYPSNRLVPNALYWRGESYYARAMYVDSIFSFKDVQTRFPDNQKTPDSLLKTAMAYQKLGDTANASLHLSVLYEDWPNSEAAKRAASLGLRP